MFRFALFVCFVCWVLFFYIIIRKYLFLIIFFELKLQYSLVSYCKISVYLEKPVSQFFFVFNFMIYFFFLSKANEISQRHALNVQLIIDAQMELSSVMLSVYDLGR